MEASTSHGLRLIALGLALGLSGQALFYSAGLGLNVLLWIGVLIAAAFLFVRPVSGDRDWAFIGALLLGSGSIAINDSPWIVTLNSLFILGTFGLYAYRTAADQPRPTLSRLLVMAACAWAQFWLEAFKVGTSVKWEELKPTDVKGQNVRAVGRGLALAIPAVVLFMCLMSSADPVFSRLLTPHIEVNAEAVILRTWIAILTGLFAIGFLRRATSPKVVAPPLPDSDLGSPTQLGQVEFITIFATLSVLVAGFVIVQGRYLFGGNDVVLATEGMSYAQYARRGFFELVALVALAVPMILGAIGMVRESSRSVRITSAVFLGLIGLVLVSAGKRMELYVGAYGLSELRFYVSASMAWLAALLVLVALAILSRSLNRLPRALGWSIAGAIGLVSFSNPDRLIAEYNLNRTTGEIVLDHSYLASLGGGSVEPLLRALPRLSKEQQHSIENELEYRYSGPEKDWRDWNYRAATARISYHRSR